MLRHIACHERSPSLLGHLLGVLILRAEIDLAVFLEGNLGLGRLIVGNIAWDVRANALAMPVEMGQVDRHPGRCCGDLELALGVVPGLPLATVVVALVEDHAVPPFDDAGAVGVIIAGQAAVRA